MEKLATIPFGRACRWCVAAPAQRPHNGRRSAAPSIVESLAFVRPSVAAWERRRQVIDQTARVHPTADLEPNVSVGPRTSIWNRAQIRRGARIGAECVIGRDAFIDEGVVIGERVKIQNAAFVYHGVTAWFPDLQVISTTGTACATVYVRTGSPFSA